MAADLRRRTVTLVTMGLVAAMAAGTLVWGTPAMAAPVLTAQRLQSSLLTIGNLPPGWSKTNASSPTTKSCYSNPIWKVPYTAKARAAFQMNSSVPQLVELLASYPNAHAAYLQVVASLNRCSRFTETVQGQKVTGTMSPVSNQRFGNESSSYTATLTVQGTQIDQEFVIARKGSTLAAVAVSDYGAVDGQLLTGLTTKAVRRIPA
ncbi:MAG TPA: hypothetical protein VNV87_05665 [Acidimicrobiales bacterium]|jgi:hypothetical protein|nr:hypothetical protein [Acidimicrobiales bacterium]